MMKRWDITVTLAEKHGFRVFAEIGVKAGKHVAEILSRVPESNVVAVDPWAVWSLPNPDRDEAIFDEVVAKYPGRVTKMKMIGLEAAPLYPDRFFDYVFIDDSHVYGDTKANILAWLPKVRSGGIIAGHDFNHLFPGVDRAVGEIFKHVTTASDHVWYVQC